MTCAGVARSKAEVELNLASMLDMAFQLLAFFILTFHPSPVEGQLSLHLPPAEPVTNVATDKPQEQSPDNAGGSTAKSLELSVFSKDGVVSKVLVGLKKAFDGPADAADLPVLDQELRDVFKKTPFEQVVIRVAPNLRYDELMKVIDVCARQKLPSGQNVNKISFVEMSAFEGLK